MCILYINNYEVLIHGEFNSADAIFAPVIMRFVDYNVKFPEFFAEYVDFVKNNKHMQNWIKAGKKDSNHQAR